MIRVTERRLLKNWFLKILHFFLPTFSCVCVLPGGPPEGILDIVVYTMCRVVFLLFLFRLFLGPKFFLAVVILQSPLVLFVCGALFSMVLGFFLVNFSFFNDSMFCVSQFPQSSYLSIIYSLYF